MNKPLTISHSHYSVVQYIGSQWGKQKMSNVQNGWQLIQEDISLPPCSKRDRFSNHTERRHALREKDPQHISCATCFFKKYSSKRKYTDDHSWPIHWWSLTPLNRKSKSWSQSWQYTSGNLQFHIVLSHRLHLIPARVFHIRKQVLTCSTLKGDLLSSHPKDQTSDHRS